MARQGRLGARGADEREARVAEVMLAHLPDGLEGARVLVVEDADGHLASGLRTLGAQVTAWSRVCAGDRPGARWPEAGPYDLAFLRLPRAREVFELALHAVASALDVRGRVFVYGANDEGIKSAKRKIEALFRSASTVATKQHCRIWTARPDAAATPHDDLEAFREEVPHPLGLGTPWTYYPGVFAKGKLDPATALLCDAMPALAPGARVLDFAAGAGVISAAAIASQPDLHVTMLETDAVALHAARQNVPSAHGLLSDGWHALPADARFAHILSNPPIHRGKSEDFSIVEALIARAPQHLTDSGALTLVIQRQVSIAPLFAGYAHVEVVAEDTRFRVWRGTIH